MLETPAAVYTLKPRAVNRLLRLSERFRDTNVSPLLRERGPGCEGCVGERERSVFMAISAMRRGRASESKEILKDIPFRDLPQCDRCRTDTLRVLKPLLEAADLVSLRVEDFTRTPVITSFTKDVPQGAMVDKEYHVPVPGGTSFVVRLLSSPGGYYYDPVLPVETLRVKDRIALNKLTRALAGSAKPPEEKAGELLANSGRESSMIASIVENFINGLGDLQYLIHDKNLTDIYVYPSGVVEVSTRDRDLKCTLRFTSRGLENLASAYRRLTGEYFYETDPLSTYFWAEHNCRISAVGYSGNYTGRPDFAVRIWPERPWHILDLVHRKALDFETAALLTAGANLGAGTILGGGRGSGKSTMLQTFMFMIPKSRRKIALMTARELHRWFGEHGFRISEMRVHTGEEVSAQGVPIARAVKQMLVHGESAYVIFNEIKYREEVVPFFTAAAAAGMSAILTTMHADNAEGVVQRLAIDFQLPLTALRTIRWVPVATLDQKAGSVFKRRVLGEVAEVLPFRADPIEEGKVKQLIRYDHRKERWEYAGVEEVTDENLADFVRESEFLTREGESRGLDPSGLAEYILLFRDAYREVYNMHQGPPDSDMFSTYMECLFRSFPEEGFTGRERQEILRRWRVCINS